MSRRIPLAQVIETSNERRAYVDLDNNPVPPAGGSSVQTAFSTGGTPESTVGATVHRLQEYNQELRDERWDLYQQIAQLRITVRELSAEKQVHYERANKWRSQAYELQDDCQHWKIQAGIQQTNVAKMDTDIKELAQNLKDKIQDYVRSQYNYGLALEEIQALRRWRDDYQDLCDKYSEKSHKFDQLHDKYVKLAHHVVDVCSMDIQFSRQHARLGQCAKELGIWQ